MNNTTISQLSKSFRQDVVLGDYGEAWVKNYLKAKQGKDVFKCDTPAFRSIDVDFTTSYELSKSNDVKAILDSNESLIEVKTDNSKYSNQCIEVVSNITTDSKGWALITEADYIFSVFPELNRCYIYDGKAFRAYAEAIKDDTSVKTLITNTYSYGKHKKLLYQSKVKIVSRKLLRDLGILIREYKLDNYELVYKAVTNGKTN